jgi:L-methionine (R)-S-oxide reductase
VTEIPLLADISRAAEGADNRDILLLEIAGLIHKQFPHYTWVGFYFLKEGKLHVGPYVGKPTPHTVIDLDKGICGAAVSQKETVVVDDVNSDPRYLACSLETKSEIVVPIRVNAEVIGELDIDSDRPAAFKPDDRRLLEQICDLIGELLANI